jgi:hypothetical protein
LLSRKNAKLEGQHSEDYRNIHVGRVVAGVDSYGAFAQILRAGHREPGPGNPNQGTRPDSRDPVLRIAFFVHHRNQQRQASEGRGDEAKERRLEEVGAPAIKAR